MVKGQKNYSKVFYSIDEHVDSENSYCPCITLSDCTGSCSFFNLLNHLVFSSKILNELSTILFLKHNIKDEYNFILQNARKTKRWAMGCTLDISLIHKSLQVTDTLIDDIKFHVEKTTEILNKNCAEFESIHEHCTNVALRNIMSEQEEFTAKNKLIRSFFPEDIRQLDLTLGVNETKKRQFWQTSRREKKNSKLKIIEDFSEYVADTIKSTEEQKKELTDHLFIKFKELVQSSFIPKNPNKVSEEISDFINSINFYPSP